MSKYIIEIAEEYEEYFKGVLICGIADGKFAVDVIAREDLEELNSDYINEHYGELQDEAYQCGYDDGYEAGCDTAFKPVSDAEYQRGFEDGKWKAEDGCDGCKYYEDTSLTNPCSECSRGHVDHYKPVSDLDRIEVGDEVEWDGDKYVVTYLNYDIETSEITDYDLLAYDGSVVDHVKKCAFTKTGKHYDIASILEAMRTHD